ncbi:Glucosamine-6-phosphate deaminase [isomerizing], alternative [Pseudonocardia sp. Ae168_Ps1]|nr:Glucosamine-6-phosphate deaminase [isomerizing], alternative [Pseudonocardia sp. Ae150A_Ps1]OLL78110.1 Glucosamine-6-phosphate deaminase [isomerizing], alternative [Pseudonocardia sp. Ae168_Ps1]OLL87766.1 Glucosamine-6-phosphate deaminase [isomerizing], alternative [Pseudonocardia sp. Ae263_Ps1]OLL92208.1 Glucosamine-6-phosphate deaminase [isomerizing], alternative [Pseudonocardia sp. Ae356_Ps1]
MPDDPGALMAAETAEQPEVWRRLLCASGPGGESGVDRVAALVRDRSPRFVLFAARGTSDHAALYAKYLTEIRLGLPAGLVSPSTLTAYAARPDLRDVLLVAVSQSGGSPDLLACVETARAQGALTVAVTNDARSALATAADGHVDVLAGPERAVAATKTYTAQLLALHLLVSAVRGEPDAGAATLPGLGERVLAGEDAVVAVAARYRFAQRMITTGRGYSYPAAREAALKLMETAYVSAQAFSGADLLHGPLALVDPLVPVLAVVSPGAGGDAMAPVLASLAARNADVLRVGGDGGLPLPGAPREELAPLLEILPMQQLARHVAVARGGDPDAPRGLAKVTETL